MGGQEASNRPNNEPMYGNGVERVVATQGLGDDTFMYQIDDGAPYKPASYSGPLSAASTRRFRSATAT
jgi:hypothetical protein